MLYIFLSCFARSNSQNSITDSFLSLKTSKEDTNKVTLLLAASSQNDITDLEKLNYSMSALTLSEKLKFQKGIILAKISLGAALNNTGKYEEALNHLNSALTLAQKTKNAKALADIYNSIGGAYYYKGDYKTALENYLISSKLFEQLNDSKKTAGIIYNISLIYYQNQDYLKATEFNSKAALMYTKLNDTIHVALTQTQFANIAYDQFQYDTAVVYHKKALKLTEKLKDQSYSLLSLIGIGGVLSEKKLHREALVYFGRSLAKARSINDQYSVVVSLMNIGKENAFINNFDESVKLLKEAIALSNTIGTRDQTCEAYSFLSETFERKKDYKNALAYAHLFMRLKDSLFSEENTEAINELNTKYESEKKEKSIALLTSELAGKQKEQVILDTKVKQKNIIIYGLLAGSLLIILSVYLFFSRKKLKQENKFQAELNLQQKNAANALVRAQENERDRIAKELHDSVGTFLSTLKLNLQAFEKKIPEEHFAAFKNNNKLIDKTSQELRKITKDLSNEVLKENGLANAINELKENINASGATHIKFLTTESTEKFDSIIELNLYRIAQELLNNSIKHSKATNITLQLIDHGDSLLLMLEDNGIGFNTESPKLEQLSGMGLKNIKERVVFLKGTLKIESILQKGSTFIIEVPKYSV